MLSLNRYSILTVVAASLAFAAVALGFAPMAAAQVMGEYGAAISNSAGSRTAAPRAALPSVPGTSVHSDSSGTTTTEIEQEDDSSAAAEDAQAKDTGTDQSSDDWERVSGSGAGQ